MQKIKLIAVDLDGTLAELREAHYISLNQALEIIDPKFTISKEEQITRFEGLSTKKKLEILVEEKGFPIAEITRVFELKQKLTSEAIQNTLNYNPLLVDTFLRLKQEGFLLFVVSNAIRATIESALKKLGIFDFFNKIISNEDVKNTKPHPEIYLKAMIEAGVDPAETLIIEDSKTGRESALRSGAHVCEVNSPSDTTYIHITNTIKQSELNNKPLKWYAKNTCNVLVLASGAGSRMRAKYKLPKPLISINNKPMIQVVVDNLNIEAQFTFVVQQEHCANYNLEAYLNLISPGCNIVKSDGLTAGAACSALLAYEYIDNDKQLLIVNSDQYVEWDSHLFMYSMLESKVDGQILTFHKENDPKWSYVSLDTNGYVTELAEKKPISNIATVGIYAFARGKDFVEGAKQMINKNIKTNGEFYLAPVYNELIEKGKKISTFSCKEMYGLGTIEDLDYFLNISKNLNIG